MKYKVCNYENQYNIKYLIWILEIKSLNTNSKHS